MRNWISIALVAVALTATACDPSQPATPSEAPPPATAPQAPAGPELPLGEAGSGVGA